MSTRLRLLLVLALIPLGSSGCTIVVSEHPLSDADTSKLDERILGTWQQLGKDGKPEKDAHPFELIRHPKMPNVIQAVPTKEKDRQRIKPGEDEIFTTVVGEHHFFSVLMGRRDADDPLGAGKANVICLYELSDDLNQINVILMDFEIVGRAIENGELTGKVALRPPDKESKPGAAKTKYKVVMVTAKPKELTAWLAKNAATCYVRERALRLQRVGEKPPQTPVATEN